MKLTVDIIDDFIALLTLTGVVNSFSDDGTNTTLNVDATFHVRAGMFITVDGNSHEVFSVNVDSQIVVVGVIINPVLFAVAPPFYFHGTPIATNQETNGKDNIDKLPMIYLAEILKEKDLDENSSIARESEVRLFFLDTANYEDWETDDYYSDRLAGLNSLIDQFILSFKKFKLFEASDTVFSRVNFAKWGVFSNNKGALRKIFDDDLTGVELSFTLKLRKCDVKDIISVCSAKTFDELVNVLGRGYSYPPPGPTTVFRVGDDADIEAKVFAPIRAANSLKVQNGLADFFTLTNNNVFGNTDNFTDSEGLQDYGATGGALVDYVINHYRNLAIHRIAAIGDNWNEAIDNALASSLNGFDDWFLINIRQLLSFYNYEGGANQGFEYSPLNGFNNLSNFRMMTSTTDTSNSLNAIAVRSAPADTYLTQVKLTNVTNPPIFCRKHF